MESLIQPETTNEASGVVLECPQCLNSCSPADNECAGCGFRFTANREPALDLDRTIHFDPVQKKRYTNTVTVQLGAASASRHRFFWMLTNLVLGGIAAAIGVFMAYAMPFGFECGMILVFVGALFVLNVYLTSDVKAKRIDGCCPNCGGNCSISTGKSTNSKTDKCQKCGHLFRYDGTRFEQFDFK